MARPSDLLPLLATAALLARPASSFGGDLAAGEAFFVRKCQFCHRVGALAQNAIGPQLNGLEGRSAAASEGYPYSEALKGSGLVWDEAAFAEFVRDPKAKVPGTKMAVLRPSEAEARDLWAFLSAFAADGARK